MKLIDAVIQTLRMAGKPLSSKEIAKRVSEDGLWETSGRTPDATIGACIYTDIKKSGEKSVFVKIAPNTFALNNALKAAEPEEISPYVVSPKKHKAVSFLDAAELVLKRTSKGTSLHYRDITEKAVNLGWLKSSGKTPDATMNAQLVTDIKRSQSKGELGRFVRTSPAYYSLIEWGETGLPYEISKHNKEVRKKLHQKLLSIRPELFEELVSQLLAEMGFESIEVTKYANDGGIDVRGILQIGDVIRIKMAVQVKRWKRNIQSPTVQQVRGSLGIHEQGLIITTSNFSKGAIEEANQPDKTPVALMNGVQLVSLLIQYNLGIRRVSHDLLELD
ncbi:MAG: HTH domain-containing protein [Kiritimatiellae bacterium]|nr:HTH domain-containing protein [Kiritimatiellia bacterium]